MTGYDACAAPVYSAQMAKKPPMLATALAATVLRAGSGERA